MQNEIIELIDISREINRQRQETKTLMKRKVILTKDILEFMKQKNKSIIQKDDWIIKQKTVTKTNSIPKDKLKQLLVEEGLSIDIDEKIKSIKKSQTHNLEIIGISFKK